MEITRLETQLVAPRWVFLQVYTDTDWLGYGEPIMEGRAQTVMQDDAVAAPTGDDGHNSIWFHDDDGSVADW